MVEGENHVDEEMGQVLSTLHERWAEIAYPSAVAFSACRRRLAIGRAPVREKV